jgi:hypothetical protein
MLKVELKKCTWCGRIGILASIKASATFRTKTLNVQIYSPQRTQRAQRKKNLGPFAVGGGEGAYQADHEEE